MAFWKKRIELPETFYHMVGECFLDWMQCHAMAEGLNPLFIKSAQACELLDLVKRGLVNLKAVISKYPIESKSLLGMSDLTTDIQACDEKKKAILGLSDQVGDVLPLSSYCGDINGMDITQFLRGLFAMETILGIHIRKAETLMAKGANISLNDFLKSSMQKVKETPHGKAVIEIARAAKKE